MLHGVPYDYSLKDGDLVSLDLAISVDGWVADSAVSFVVGKDPDPEDLRIIKCTEEALAAAIDVAKPGNRLGDISNTIGDVARSSRIRRTAGPCVPPTARAAPTPSTPSPSPRTARSSSPIAPTSDRRLAYGRCLIGL